MHQIISDAVVETKAELKRAPTAPDHITHRAFWPQHLGARFWPRWRMWCRRGHGHGRQGLWQAHTEGWSLSLGPLVLKALPSSATEGGSSPCRMPAVPAACLPSSFHLDKLLPHSGLLSKVCLGPTCKTGKGYIISFLSLSGTSRTFLFSPYEPYKPIFHWKGAKALVGFLFVPDPWVVFLYRDHWALFTWDHSVPHCWNS